ncbi:EndoU domain-containing protein [Heyndrickxia acidiproducens]|uniref:EndoU domain-containing protein n=1 Tax=Heyndrickxia acidiproducens TaxID=1121084 RepID=UPI002287038C|nr:EndoU domain-containing protein [Heyndrickxia acidiproducens]
MAEKAEKLRVNTGVTPAIQAAGEGPAKIPYNVMDELGIRLQKATEERWKGSKGTGKYSTGTLKHIFHGEINRRMKAVGYHHESMMGGKVIPGTETKPDKNGVYRAKVEIEGG